MNVDFGLRQATDDDYDFVWRLQSTTMKPYVEKIWGWDEQWQVMRFKQTFIPAKNQMIQFNGEDAGVLALERRQNDVFLANIQISQQFQAQGLGTSVINTILHEASKSKRPVTLQVFKINPAQKLYQRLGFEIVDTTPTHYLMST